MKARESTIQRLRAVSEFLVFALLPILVVAGDGGVGRVFGWVAGLAVIAARWPARTPPNLWIVAALSGTVGSVIGPAWFRGTAYHAGTVALSVVGLVVVVLGERISARLALTVAGAGSLVALLWSVTHDPGGVLDVTLMHQAGADALRAGVTPWSGLSVPSGAWGMEGGVITGDPYPPVALILYSIGDWTTGDPRAAGALAWIILIGATMVLGLKNHIPAVVLATSGALPLLLWTGWTELLTISLVAAAAALWRSPVVASTVLGLALASKQYMVVALPLVMALSSRPERLRRVVSIVVAAVAALAGFAFGAGYLQATVFAYGDFATRSDSSSLYGFVSIFAPPFGVPFWLGPVAAFATATWLAVRRQIEDVAAWLRASAVSLSVLFLLGTQAFSNYWFLVWALLLIAWMGEDPSDAESVEEAPLRGNLPTRSPAR